MVEGEPDCRLVYAGGTVYMVDVGVPIDLDALASETAVPHRRRPAVPRSTLVTARRHLPISYFARFGVLLGRKGR